MTFTVIPADVPVALVVMEPKEALIVLVPLEYVLYSMVISKGPAHPLKPALTVRSLSMTTLMVTLEVSLSPISPDHCSNSHPSDGTAVNVTMVPGG